MKQLTLFAMTKDQARSQILRFLNLEAWSSDRNLSELLGVSSRQFKVFIKPLIKEKFVKHLHLPIVGGYLDLYGLTKLGLKTISSDEQSSCQVESRPKLLGSKLSATLVPHRLDIQLLRIRAEKKGWTQWVNSDFGREFDKNKNSCASPITADNVRDSRPDALSTDENKLRVCIEYERSIKSKNRYEQKLCDYLIALRRGDFDRVVWVSPNERVRETLKRVITSITHVQIGSMSVVIPRSRFQSMSFLTIEEWAL
jgi:hypothetical protein